MNFRTGVPGLSMKSTHERENAIREEERQRIESILRPVDKLTIQAHAKI